MGHTSQCKESRESFQNLKEIVDESLMILIRVSQPDFLLGKYLFHRSVTVHDIVSVPMGMHGPILAVANEYASCRHEQYPPRNFSYGRISVWLSNEEAHLALECAHATTGTCQCDLFLEVQQPI